MKRIAVIVNKTWEAAPILAVFTAPYAATSNASSRPLYWSGQLAYPSTQMWPGTDGLLKFPLRYTLQFGDVTVECWCLADFEDTSDSIKKTGFIRRIVSAKDETPDLVIAVGTAASVVSGLQGSVMVGTRAFMHDAYPDTPPQSQRPDYWPIKFVDTMMTSPFAEHLDNLMAGIHPSWTTNAQLLMIPARNGEGRLRIEIDSALVAVGDVNIGAKYSQYPFKDPEAINACLMVDHSARIASIETTNALIRAMIDPIPFIFISAIVNDMGQLARDVNPTEYAQNFVGAHNAGVVLAALLPQIAAQSQQN